MKSCFSWTSKIRSLVFTWLFEANFDLRGTKKAPKHEQKLSDSLETLAIDSTHGYYKSTKFGGDLTTLTSRNCEKMF